MNISKTSISEAGLLYTAINCNALRKVDFSSTSITQRVIEYLVRNNPKLISIELSDCKFIDNQSVFCISQLPLLQTFKIRKNSNITINPFIKLISSCKVLSMLDVTDCPLLREDSILKLKSRSNLLEIAFIPQDNNKSEENVDQEFNDDYSLS